MLTRTSKRGGDLISLRRILSVLGMMPLLSCGEYPSEEGYRYVVQSGAIISYEQGRVFRIYSRDNKFIKEEI